MVLMFEQDDVFAKYVTDIAAQRARSTSERMKSYCKLLMNALDGKTIEDIMKHSDFKLCNGVASTPYDKLFKNPRFCQARDLWL